MNKLLFSIIIPSYNRAHILSRTIVSVLAQTYTNWELLIVDDGSTDATKVVVENYNDERIHYIKKENGGVCSARNLGANHTKGEYIVFLDSDDEVNNDCLKHFKERITEFEKPDIICGGLEKINIENNKSSFVKPTHYGNGAIGWAVVAPGSFAVKKAFLFLSGLYDENIKFGENTELFIRFREQNPNIKYSDHYDLKYYPSKNGGGKNLMNKIVSNEYILKKHDSILSSNTKYLFNKIIAVNYQKLGNNKKASHYFAKAIKYKPFRLDTYIRLLISKSSFLQSILINKKN